MKKKIVILISGHGSNLRSIINATKKANYPASISLVVSDTSIAQGLNIAKDNDIDTFIVERSSFDDKIEFEKDLIEKIIQYDPHLICLAGFMVILSRGFVEKFKGKIINIHPSLLPKYKGLKTHERAINSGDKFSGCTVHYVNDELDGGEIIAQKRVAITSDDTIDTLRNKILEHEHMLYPSAIKTLLS